MGSFFSYYHNYNNEGLGFFFLVAINIVGGGISLRFLSWCNDEKEQHVFDKDEISTFLSLLALQIACPKAYKSTTTNCYQSFNVKGNFLIFFSKVNGTWAIRV